MGKFAHHDLPWSEAPILLSLARSKSFAAAARDLRIDRTTVARRLDRLESQLGTQLFERFAGQLELTQEGRRIMTFVEKAEQELSQLDTDQQSRRLGFGKVRISLSQHVLSAFAKQLNQFIVGHPAVFLELTTSDRFVDLYKYEADIALRIGKSPPENLHSIDLGPVRFGLYQQASQTSPLKTFWAPPGKTELSDQMQAVSRQANVIAAIDGVLPTRDMILAGGGAGVLPKFLGHGDPRLVACSDEMAMGSHRMSMNCLPDQRNLRRIQLVMKQLSSTLKEALNELDGHK